MPLNADEFVVNDIGSFPIVRIATTDRSESGLDQWTRELEILIKNGVRFVMIGRGEMNEVPEETRLRAAWYNENKTRLGVVLAGMVLLEPDQQKYQKMAPAIEKAGAAFPWQAAIAASEEEAERLASSMLTE